MNVVLTFSLLLAVAMSGCQTTLNAMYPPGELAPDGKVYPCNDYRTNAQACGEAIFNAPRVAKLSVGMSMAETKAIMVRAAEERSARTEGGKSIEVWGYLTNYDRSVLSQITFVDGRIASIEGVQR
jgi:hypothetical protein